MQQSQNIIINTYPPEPNLYYTEDKIHYGCGICIEMTQFNHPSQLPQYNNIQYKNT